MTIRPAWISFGGTAGIVTSMGLIWGLEAAHGSRQALVSALLIVALGDNLSDSLSVHIYQEAERLEPHEAMRSTLANFVTRLLVAASFIALALTLPRETLIVASVAWGLFLLAVLTYRIARARRASVGKEIAKHFLIASLVLVLSRALGAWVAHTFT